MVVYISHIWYSFIAVFTLTPIPHPHSSHPIHLPPFLAVSYLDSCNTIQTEAPVEREMLSTPNTILSETSVNSERMLSIANHILDSERMLSTANHILDLNNPLSNAIDIHSCKYTTFQFLDLIHPYLFAKDTTTK